VSGALEMSLSTQGVWKSAAAASPPKTWSWASARTASGTARCSESSSSSVLTVSAGSSPGASRKPWPANISPYALTRGNGWWHCTQLMP
jgi:hypothetical protein